MAAKKITYGLIAASALIIYLMTKSTKAFSAPTADNKLRGCDPKGCGHFGASRGSRKHSGIDFKINAGDKVFAPIGGQVTRHPFPYADDLNYKGIEIVNADYKVKMFYLTPTVPVNTIVKAGQSIGIAQNISAKHGAAMTNHVHFEVYKKNGSAWVLIDPSEMFGIGLNYHMILHKGLKNSREVKKLQEFLNVAIDGDFGPLTESALMAAKGVKQITLNAF